MGAGTALTENKKHLESCMSVERLETVGCARVYSLCEWTESCEPLEAWETPVVQKVCVLCYNIIRGATPYLFHCVLMNDSPRFLSGQRATSSWNTAQVHQVVLAHPALCAAHSLSIWCECLCLEHTGSRNVVTDVEFLLQTVEHG